MIIDTVRFESIILLFLFIPHGFMFTFPDFFWINQVFFMILFDLICWIYLRGDLCRSLGSRFFPTDFCCIGLPRLSSIFSEKVHWPLPQYFLPMLWPWKSLKAKAIVGVFSFASHIYKQLSFIAWWPVS